MNGKKRESMERILRFMGSLNKNYTADEMRRLWGAMDEMRHRYGDVFVADAISKSSVEAELALFRYARKLERQKAQRDPQDVPYTARWTHVYPSRGNLERKLAAFFTVALIAGIAVFTLIAGAGVA